MIPVEFIIQKRNAQAHAKEDFDAFFKAYSAGAIPDYQMTAWLMTAFINALSTQEKVWLTEAVINSGERFDLSHIDAPKVDKHSTGGVGDKTSLVLLPLLASMGACVPMMSGRGLGHTGGTLDKLESIPGMTVQMDKERYTAILEELHGAFMAQTSTIAPLDKRLYALRDVTGTVESIGLITASIIGKKMTEDLDGLVLDVKYGNGAFMKTLEHARQLAESLVDTSQEMGVATIALITDMNEPLGEYAGNAVEVLESIAMLKGEPVEARFKDVTMALAREMCKAAWPGKNGTNWHANLEEKLRNGDAYERFEHILHAQGVSFETIRSLPESLPIAKIRIDVQARETGYIRRFDTYRIGQLLVELGAGRLKADDRIDPGVGVRIVKHAGDQVDRGDVIAQLIVHSAVDPSAFDGCIEVSPEPCTVPALIKEKVA